MKAPEPIYPPKPVVEDEAVLFGRALDKLVEATDKSVTAMLTPAESKALLDHITKNPEWT